MWNKATMTFGESVIISLMGLSVVFLALIVLALAVYLISLILRTVSPVQAIRARRGRPSCRQKSRRNRKMIRNCWQRCRRRSQMISGFRRTNSE